MSTQTTIQTQSLTDKINSFKLSNLFKSSKALNNNSINNIPDLNTYLSQKKTVLDSAKSTQGLVGFSGDNPNVDQAILLGQNLDSIEALQEHQRQEQFGNVQINTDTNGGTQTKTVKVGADILTTVSQEQLAKLSASQRAQFDALWKKLTSVPSPFQAVQTLTSDSVNRAGNGADNKVTITQATGIRAIIDNINSTIQGKIAGFGALKPQSKPTGNDVTPGPNITNSSSSDLNAVQSGDPQSFDSVSESQV